MKPQSSVTLRTTAAAHEAGFVAAFVLPEKRSRYAEFLSQSEHRQQILGRFNHFFDFVPERATRVPRAFAPELARLLRARGAGEVGYVMGGDRDGRELPLEEAIDSSLASPCGAVISCLPGCLALYLQEFPPGDTFLLPSNERNA